MIRESGSVKFLWAFGRGVAVSGSGTRGGRPPNFRPRSFSYLFPLRQAPAGIRGLLFGLLAGFGLKSRFGFAYLPQAAFAPGRLGREFIAAHLRHRGGPL